MKDEKYTEVIPIAILTVIGLYSIIKVTTSEYILGSAQYIGLTMLGISIALYFINRRAYKYFFGITLLLGLANLIAFTVSITTLSIPGIQIQLLPLPFIGLFYWIHREDIIPMTRGLLENKEVSTEARNTSKVNKFKTVFKGLSNNEIEARLKKGLVPEAVEALKSIQADRKAVK